MKNWQKWLGILGSVGIIVSCFMPWAFYSDLGKHFTAFDSKVLYHGRMMNYYGRPGFILCFLGSLCLLFHLLPKLWAKRINLASGCLCLAFALKSYFTYTSAYAGNVPVKEAGIILLLVASLANFVGIIFVKRPE